MTETLNIQKVINTSTSNVSLDDLSKKGFKQVKVLNQAVITRLIGEAVDRVLADRSKEIGKEEREKVIKEARGQFETLAKKRLEKERTRIEDLEHVNASLASELDTLKKRLTASVEVQAERDQAVRRLGTLDAEVAQLRNAVPELEVNFAKKKAEVQGLQAELERYRLEAQRSSTSRAEDSSALEEEVTALREALSESEHKAAIAEGQLTAKNEELERLAENSMSGPAAEKLLLAVNARLQSVAAPVEVGQIMASLDTLSRRLSNMSGSTSGDTELTSDIALDRLFDAEEGGSVESNISKVKVKETAARDVKGALAKLKKLQKGIKGGE
ncbi:MAG TPA: hypothetical protein VMT52_10095 [Planctomycetota bacterium]|nr:hypothetical protein [Planctomycetota bacterium]